VGSKKKRRRKAGRANNTKGSALGQDHCQTQEVIIFSRGKNRAEEEKKGVVGGSQRPREKEGGLRGTHPEGNRKKKLIPPLKSWEAKIEKRGKRSENIIFSEKSGSG